MKTLQQEVLLITGTSFTSRQFIDKDEEEPDGSSDERDRLLELCWNGLLPELLPELFQNMYTPKKLFLWSILEGDSFLEIDLGEYPNAKEGYFSIDPHLFLVEQELN